MNVCNCLVFVHNVLAIYLLVFHGKLNGFLPSSLTILKGFIAMYVIMPPVKCCQNLTPQIIGDMFLGDRNETWSTNTYVGILQ